MTNGSWVYGLRSDKDHRDDWQKILFARLTGRFHAVEPGRRTRLAEEGLGIRPHHLYYFVDRCVPAFGFLAVAYDPPVVEAAVISPFDTGGLWFDYFATSSALKPHEKAQLVTDHSYQIDGYRTLFWPWVKAAFNFHSEYVAGVEPRTSFTEVIPVAGNNTHAWAWEGRVPRDEYDKSPCTPVLVVMASEDASAYLDWVEGSPLMDEATKLEHIHFFNGLLMAADSPIDTMNSLVAQN